MFIHKEREFPMNHYFSLFMFIFTAALLLYAVILAITKDYKMLPLRSRLSVHPRNPRKYTVQLAKAIALVAAAFAVGAIVSLWNGLAGLGVMILGLIVTIRLSTRIVTDR